MNPKFNIKDLELYYGSFKALKGINMQIEANEITAFIGPSGCGFRVIIVIEANSYVNIRSSRLLPKFKTQKINSWCAA